MIVILSKSKKRHRNRSYTWLQNKYYTSIGKNNWRLYSGESILGTYSGVRQAINVKLPVDVKVFRLENKDIIHQKWLKFKQIGLYGDKLKLWKLQDGICKQCSNLIVEPREVDIHHVIPRALGGTNALSNLMLLHEHCHYQQVDSHSLAR